jgi:hypothetical protein
MEAACPSETTGQVTQLAAQLAKLITDIRGEAGSPEQGVDSKPGLLDKADRLITNLNRVQ